MKKIDLDQIIAETLDGETQGKASRKALRVALIAAAVIVAIGVVAGVYLLLGWVLALLVGFIAGGAFTISVLQGAAILLAANLLFGGIASTVRG